MINKRRLLDQVLPFFLCNLSQTKFSTIFMCVLVKIIIFLQNLLDFVEKNVAPSCVHFAGLSLIPPRTSFSYCTSSSLD